MKLGIGHCHSNSFPFSGPLEELNGLQTTPGLGELERDAQISMCKQAYLFIFLLILSRRVRNVLRNTFANGFFKPKWLNLSLFLRQF